MRHSYTKISMYMECPRSKRYRYDERREVAPSAAAARGTRYHRAIEAYIIGDNATHETPGTAEFPELSFYGDYLQRLRANGATAEFAFALTRDWKVTTWDTDDAWILGKSDIWVPSLPTAHVQDWKTGKIYDSHEKQGEFYAMSHFSYVPEAREIKATFIYTDLRKTREWTYHRDQLESLRSRWQARIERMERDTECAPTPSFRCRSCPFSKAKGGPCQF